MILDKNCNFITMGKEYNLRKKIAKHGENSIIVIPKLLRGELKPKTIVEINIKILEEAKEE
ncbi:MAG: hypothetical protein Q8P57_02470 [Candidatus Pacearchaeota archaeon]|nr:hypothetical protein [Candidatus Pacearchaeota archaeon]